MFCFTSLSLCSDLQTMSVDDFATMLAYLVRVCWSAAAGQLHLASISDSQPPSPALHHRGNRETTPTSLMDRTSGQEGEGGVGRTSQLRAGLCLQQETDSVSSKVSQTRDVTILLIPTPPSHSECSHSPRGSGAAGDMSEAALSPPQHVLHPPQHGGFHH